MRRRCFVRRSAVRLRDSLRRDELTLEDGFDNRARVPKGVDDFWCNPLMARIRTIKPDYWQHPKTASVTRDARLLFLGLLNEADDEGRMRYSAKRLAGVLFPFDDDVTPKLLDSWVRQLELVGLVDRYEVEDAFYLAVPGFTEHQRISHAKPSVLPERPVGTCAEDARNVRGSFTEPARGEVEREREQGRGIELASPTPKDDGLWNAVMLACGIEGAITNGARAGYGKAVKELRGAGATPQEVPVRARNHRQLWPQASLTPHSLAKHWAELTKVPAPVGQAESLIQRMQVREGRA